MNLIVLKFFVLSLFAPFQKKEYKKSSVISLEQIE